MTVAPADARDLSGSISRIGVDDEHLVDDARPEERTNRGAQDGRQRLGALLRRNHDDDGRSALALAKSLRWERGRRIAPSLGPRGDGKVDRQPTRRAADRARRRADTDIGCPEDRYAVLGQPGGEHCVLETGDRLQAADILVDAGGHGHGRPREMVMGSSRIGLPDSAEALSRIPLAAAEHARGQLWRLLGI